MCYSIGFIGSIGPTELLLFMAIGLLIFGKRLPEVGKSLGKGISEFKKGLTGVEDEADGSGKGGGEARGGSASRKEPARLDHDPIELDTSGTEAGGKRSDAGVNSTHKQV